MGGQNTTNAQREQQNADRQKAEASNQQPIQSGGQGNIGGKYGVQISNPSATSQGLKDATNSTQKGQGYDWNAKESEFATSLVKNAGLVKPSTFEEYNGGNNPYDNALNAWERGNNLIRDKSALDESL